MSDRFSISIEIGGQLESSKIQELIGKINSEDLSLDWGESPVRLKTKKDLLNCISPTGTALYFVDDERAWGNIDDLEQACQELGLVYKIIIEPRYEYSGELKFWSPETGLIELECESGGRPVATQEDLKEILHLLHGATVLSISKQQFDKVDKAIKKLEGLTREFTVPPFEIVEK